MMPAESLSCGWISDSGTFTWALSVTGYGQSWIPVPVTADGDSLTVTLTCPLEAS